MITGTLMFDIGIEVKDEDELKTLSSAIYQSVKQINGVVSAEEVDCDVNESDDEA